MTPEDWFKLGQYVVTFISGGLAGTILNYFINQRKDKVQPVGMKMTVSYVDVPDILQGYGAQIALKNIDGSDNRVHFKNIAVIRIELTNSGNKDLEYLKLGVNLPDNSEAIGFEAEGEDRYHTIKTEAPISTVSRQSELDVEMKPFHRKNKYVMTIIANTPTRIKKDAIRLSKSIPIRFVENDITDKEFVSIADQIVKGHNVLLIVSLVIASVLFVLKTNTAEQTKAEQAKKLEEIRETTEKQNRMLMDSLIKLYRTMPRR